MNRFNKLVWLVLTCLFASYAMAGDTVDEEVQASNNSRVKIENMRGKVEIVGWDEPKVSVKGKLDENVEDFIFEQSGNTIKVIVKMPKVSGHKWRGKGSDLVIRAPHGASIQFSGVSSDVVIENFTSGAEIKSVSGNIEAKSISDRVSLTTVSGKISSSDLSGKIKLSNVSGDITDQDSSGRMMIKNVSGDIESDGKVEDIMINTVSGDVELTLAEINDITAKSVSGKILTNMALRANSRVDFSSISGSILVDLDGDIDANFNVQSNSGGKIVNNISDHDVVKAKYGSKATLNFQQGNGSAQVRISSLSGSIKLSD